MFWIFKKLIYKFRNFYFDQRYSLAGSISQKIKDARGLRVIAFHGVVDRDPFKFNARFVDIHYFEEQVLLLKKHFNIISYHDFISGKLLDSQLNILITFDDGLKNNYTLALPILKKHSIPAVFFTTLLHLTKTPFLFNDIADVAPLYGNEKIVIDNNTYYRTKVFNSYRYVDATNVQLAHRYHGSDFNKRLEIVKQLLEDTSLDQLNKDAAYFELLNEQELKDISSHPLFTVASHGAYHTDMSSLSSVDLIGELTNSIHYLKSITGNADIALAFPYGAYNDDVIELCHNLDIKILFGTEIIHNAKDEKHIVKRIQLNPYISSINQLYYISKGEYA